MVIAYASIGCHSWQAEDIGPNHPTETTKIIEAAAVDEPVWDSGEFHALLRYSSTSLLPHLPVSNLVPQVREVESPPIARDDPSEGRIFPISRIREN